MTTPTPVLRPRKVAPRAVECNTLWYGTRYLRSTAPNTPPCRSARAPARNGFLRLRSGPRGRFGLGSGHGERRAGCALAARALADVFERDALAVLDVGRLLERDEDHHLASACGGSARYVWSSKSPQATGMSEEEMALADAARANKSRGGRKQKQKQKQKRQRRGRTA